MKKCSFLFSILLYYGNFCRKVVLILSENKKKPLLFKIIKSTIRFFYPKIEVVGMENIPDEPCVIVGNHTQLHGPISSELFFPDTFYTWCAAQMMELKEVPAYAYTDFWSQKPKILRPFFKAVAYLIAPLSVVIFNNARTVPVYHDSRILTTLRESIKKLTEGNNIVIFPERDKKHNNIVYDFQEGFVDVAKLYHRRTGTELSFVPLYIAPKLRRMYIGKPIRFSANAPIADERRRISDALMAEITDIARGLPEHVVVPYRNIPKRLYPKNTDKEA